MFLGSQKLYRRGLSGPGRFYQAGQIVGGEARRHCCKMIRDVSSDAATNTDDSDADKGRPVNN